MKAKVRQHLRNCKRRIERRLNPANLGGFWKPIMTARNIEYEAGERVRGISYGGIGAIHLLAQKIGLIDSINAHVPILKLHLPYHESDHVLNFAYNALSAGTCLQDMERLRQDEVYLDALGARRTPDPTTAGDFCRRFDRESIQRLQAVFDDSRLKVWAKQPPEFFEQARIDMDGILVGTDGEKKQGMNLAYDGTWGYHPLVVSLANTCEVLRIVNRPGNRPSHEGAAEQVDEAMLVCFLGGFQQVLLRGDTDFSQTSHLDRWNANPRVKFVFGYDAVPRLVKIAEELPAQSWKPLERPARVARTGPRQKRENVKEGIVVERKFENLKLQGEDVAEFPYRPTACQETYRLVVVRKKVAHLEGQRRLFDEFVYFFYITNLREEPAAAIVFTANDRCNQENLLAQLAGGMRALHAPLDTLESNWAYMVMTGLGWNLKAWLALSLPETPGRWRERHQEDKRRVLTMEFRTFVNTFMRIPCQIVRTGRRIIYRILSWNPHLHIFYRVAHVLRC